MPRQRIWRAGMTLAEWSRYVATMGFLIALIFLAVPPVTRTANAPPVAALTPASLVDVSRVAPRPAWLPRAMPHQIVAPSMERDRTAFPVETTLGSGWASWEG